MSTIEAEVVEPENHMALAIRQTQPIGLFGTTEPGAVIEKATSVANALKGVIVRQGLVSKISGKEYPRCEAWTLLGTMLGVFPVTVWTKEVEGGWEARVEARTKDGSVIGAAEAQCLRSEKNWANRDDFALRSMAQTRATAKCLRMPLGFVMTLAGFEATPAEEMVNDHPKNSPVPSRRATPLSRHTPPAQSRSQGQARNAAPAKTPPAPEKRYATAESLQKLIARLEPCRDLAIEYFRKVREPGVLLPNENLEDLPLWVVPLTVKQAEALDDAIRDFGNGGEVRHAYRPNDLRPVEKPTTKPAAPAPEPGAKKPPPQVAAAKEKDPEWWRAVLCPPFKGMKRDEYLKNPQTLGQLYDARHEDAMGKRLFGFVKHFEVNTKWTDTQGQIRQRSENQVETDQLFRDALDACAEYAEKHHGDTEHDDITRVVSRQPMAAHDDITRVVSRQPMAAHDDQVQDEPEDDVPF